MRDEKEERKKQARSNKQTRQSNTALPTELPRQLSWLGPNLTSHSTPDVYIHVLYDALHIYIMYSKLCVMLCKLKLNIYNMVKQAAAILLSQSCACCVCVCPHPEVSTGHRHHPTFSSDHPACQSCCLATQNHLPKWGRLQISVFHEEEEANTHEQYVKSNISE